MNKLMNLRLADIDPSPHRDLKRFPLNEENVADLMAKMSEAGILPATGGTAVRPFGDRYQMAYGHHRAEALRRLGKDTIEVLVSDIDDEHMVKYLASENKALKNSGFVAQYESWLATEEYLSGGTAGKPKPLDVAKFLGWTSIEVKNGKKYVTANALATTCNNFTTLVEEMVMEEIACLPWTNNTARDMVKNQMALRNDTRKKAEKQNLSEEETTAELARVAEAGRRVVARVNAGDVAPTNAKTELSKELHNITMHHKDLKDVEKIDRIKEREADRKKYGPAFDTAVKTLITGMDTILATDSFAKRLDDMVYALDVLQQEGKHGELINMASALDRIAARAENYAYALRQPAKSKLTAIEGGK